MRIRHQFLLTLLGASLVIVLLVALLTQLTFQRSLDTYLVQRQQTLLEELSLEFADYYTTYGSFDGITLRALIWNMEGQGRRRIPPDLILLDAQRYPLFGPPLEPERLVTHNIEVNNETVGWLGLPSSPNFRERIEQRYAQRQQNLLFSVAGVSLLLAVFGAWWLSRKLVRPIERIADFSQQLSRGDYQARLDSARADELGQLSRAMNGLAHSLEQTQQSRQRWLADLSHELRTPMTVLRAELEAMQDGVRPLSAEKINHLHAQTVHLSKLLDDLHDLALADAGALRYSMEPVDINLLIQQCCTSQKSTLATRQHTLTINLPTSPSMMQGDAKRLRQLFDNLLNNSDKYTDKPGATEIIVTHQRGNIIICISDSAPGVSDEQLPYLFDYLYRAEDSRNRRTGGAGLGLAISRRIVEAHRGSIKARHSDSISDSTGDNTSDSNRASGGLTIEIHFPGDAP